MLLFFAQVCINHPGIVLVYIGQPAPEIGEGGGGNFCCAYDIIVIPGVAMRVQDYMGVVVRDDHKIAGLPKPDNCL